MNLLGVEPGEKPVERQDVTKVKKADLFLPDTISELSKFILVGREKLNSVRAEIRAIDKLNLAKDVHEQKLDEGQMLAETIIDAEVKMGELIIEIDKKEIVK